MITAKEAKELYDQSGQEVNDFLKYKVQSKVIDAAKGGKRSTTIFLGSLEQFHHLDQVITPLEKAVVEKLKELGYHAEIKADGEFYVPRGWADDDGNGRKVQNYDIHIGW
jgi:hypothetical protein